MNKEYIFWGVGFLLWMMVITYIADENDDELFILLASLLLIVCPIMLIVRGIFF